jgi:hypothetical protein
MGDCLLWTFFENYKGIPHFWAHYFHGYVYALILTKMGCATFLMIFSHTHLVTLFMDTIVEPNQKHFSNLQKSIFRTFH